MRIAVGRIVYGAHEMINFAGKSTLIRMILGQQEPDSGEIVVGDTVNVVSVGQERMDALDSSKTVFEEISQGADDIELGTQTIQSRAYLSWFGFKGGQQQAFVGNLSGGERNRVSWLKFSKKEATSSFSMNLQMI